MKIKHFNLLFAIVTLIFFASCNNQSQKNIMDDVIINEETGEISFANSTEDAIELNYNFKINDVVENTINVDMEIEMMGQKMPMSMILESKYEIKDIDDNGNADVNYSITRMSIDAATQGIKFDSNNKTDNIQPEMAPMLKLLNKNVTLKTSPKGKVLSVDLSQIEDLGADLEMIKTSMEQNLQQFNQSTFATLPEGTVKAGDSYDGGVVEQIVQGFPMKTSTQYIVKSISNDKTKVIIETKGNLEFNATNLPEGMSLEMKSSEISGWVIIDISRGISLQSKFYSIMDFTTSQMGQSFGMVLKSNTTMKIK